MVGKSLNPFIIDMKDSHMKEANLILKLACEFCPVLSFNSYSANCLHSFKKRMMSTVKHCQISLGGSTV